MDASGATSKVPEAVVPNGRPNGQTGQRYNRDRGQVAPRWCGQLIENPEFEEEDHPYPTKFHGDQVI